MKAHYLLPAIIAILMCNAASAQSVDKDTCDCEPPDAVFKMCDSLVCCAQEMAETLHGELSREVGFEGNYLRLVTQGTFNRILSTDMAKVLTLDNAINRATRYAAVSIDEDKSTFSFSPLAARLHSHVFRRQDPSAPYLPTWGFVNAFVKGKINNNGFAELFSGGKANREFTAGGTFSFFFLTSNKYRTGGNACCGNRYSNFRIAQANLPAALCKKYQAMLQSVGTGDVLSYAENADNLCECDDLKAAMRKDFMDVEENLAKPFWSGRSCHWVSISPEYGGKTIALLDTSKAGAAPENKTFGTGSLRVSLNYLREVSTRSGTWSMYGAASGSLKRSNQFSDLSTVTWNKYVSRPDTSELITDNKDVFLYSGGSIDHQILPSASIQGIGLWNGSHFGLGVDISFTYDQLYKPAGGPSNHKTTESYGIVFPFNDKDGDRTINLSVFYQHSWYKLSSMDDEFLVGVKFAVPIFSVD